MKIVSWNILQGGGRRLEGVCDALVGHAPDIVVLQEVRAKSEAALCKRLGEIGLKHSFLSQTQTTAENTIFMASKQPVDAGDFIEDRDGLCHVLEGETAGLTLLPVHFPQKAAQVPLFEALLADSASLLGLEALVIGDLNCGLPYQDSTAKTFVNAKYFQALKDAGWCDLYRQVHGPDALDFSWVSPRSGRGFRYDHALASPSLAQRVRDVSYDHSVRESGLSDHSLLAVELD